MDKHWLLERLENPALLEKGDEQQLREFIAAYPYFSAPYLLLARSLKTQNHPAFDEILPFISLQAWDRKKLFKLVNEESIERRAESQEKSTVDSQQSTVKEEDKVSEESTPVSLNEAEDRGLEESVEQLSVVSNQLSVEEDSIIEEQPQTENREPTTVFQVDFSEIEKSEETEETSAPEAEMREIPFLLRKDEGLSVDSDQLAVEETPTNNPEPVSLSEAEDQGLEESGERRAESEEELSVVSEQLAVEETPTNNPEPVSLSEAEDQGLEDSRERGAESEEELTVVSDQSSVEEEPQTDNREPITEQKTDFLHWLDKLNDTTEVAVKVEEKPKAETEDKPEAPDLKPEANREEVIDETVAAAADSSTDLLIDKFIETNPSITRVQGNFYNPAEKAKESERLDERLITETMAKIFVKQEKYDKAIDAYQKLQLKYPQKSDYFAALIEELNSKIS